VVVAGKRADPQFGDGSGLSRFWPLGICPVALFGMLDRLQSYQRGRRQLGIDQRRSAARHCVRAVLPAKMRGFGHVKARNVETAKACETELLGLIRNENVAASAT
jgi:hypothetical protein